MELLREMHDMLLAQKPSDVAHDVANCPLCAPPGDSTIESPELGGDMSFTQEDIDAAVAAAVKPLNEKIASIESANAESELEAQHAAEKAELEARVAELEGKLDSAVLEAEEAKRTHSEYVAELEAIAADEAAKAEVAARKEERLAVVREVASFPEAHIEARADRWAELSEEDFASLVDDWKAVASKEEAPAGSELPSDTAIDTAGRESTPGTKSPLTELLTLTTVGGFDTKSL